MPAVGSSSSSSRGSVASARAISSRRWSPYGRFLASSSSLSPRPTKASSSRARSRARASSATTARRPKHGAGHARHSRQCSPTSTFSSTVMFWKSRIDWKVRAMPRSTIALGRSPTRLAPSKVMLAAVRPDQAGHHVEEGGLAGAVRADQPDDGARAGSTRSTSLTAIRPPKRLVDAAHLENGRASRAARRGGHALAQPAGMASTRGGRRRLDGAPRSSTSGRPRGRTRRPARPSGRSSITSDQPEAEEEPAPEREVDARRAAARRCVRPIQRTKKVICASRTRSKSVISIAAQDHALEAARAAEHDHAQQHDRDVELEGAGRDGLELGRVDGAGEAREGRAEREGQELGRDRVDAGAVGGRLVLADRHPGPAQARVAQPVHGPDATARR